MSKKEENIKQHLQNKLSKSFTGLEYASDQHKDLKEMFGRLLHNMEADLQTKAHKKALLNATKNIEEFSHYLLEYKTIITEYEKKEIMAITGSRFSPIIKNRMLEDFFYKVKQRIEKQKEIDNDNKNIKKEIADLRLPRSKFSRYVQLFKFAWRFRTLTLFSHCLREETLDILKK